MDRHVHKSYEKMKKWFSELGSLPLLEEEPNEEVDDEFEEEEIEAESVEVEGSTPVPVPNETEKKHMSSTTWKPFGAYFELKLKSVHISADTSFPSNPLYQPRFLTKLLLNWLPTSPFWSSMLRGKCRKMQ